MPIMNEDDVLRLEPGMTSELIEGGFADEDKEIEVLGTAEVDTPTGKVPWTKVKLLDDAIAAEGWVRTSHVDLQGVPPSGPIDKLKFANQCWVEALFSDANPHYVAAVAEMRSKTVTGQESAAPLGPFIGPFRFTQAEWDAGRGMPEFSVGNFSARDIVDWRIQVSLFTLMAHRSEAALTEALNAVTADRRPSAAELYLAQIIGAKAAAIALTKNPAPTIKEAFDGVPAADQAKDRPLGQSDFGKIVDRFKEILETGTMRAADAIDRIVARLDPVLTATRDNVIQAGTALVGPIVADVALSDGKSQLDQGGSLANSGRTFTEKAPPIMRKLMTTFPQLRDFHAAGVLGNIGRETGGFRLMQEVRPRKGRGGLGWLQWTGDRRVKFENFCRPPVPGTDTDDGNFAFMIHEMQHDEIKAFEAFSVTTNLDDATEVFMLRYERPGVPALAERKDFARQALTAFRNAAAGGGTASGGGGTSGSGGLAAQLSAQIAAGKIIFDSPALKDQLLGGASNGGVRVTGKLQSLVLKLSTMVPKIRISSLIRPAAGSHHAVGRAVDIGNEEIAGILLPLIATPQKVAELGIDELIFDARKISPANDKNKFNFDQGLKHDFNDATIHDHGDHIHFAVKADTLS
jgi:hypothetical protein